MKRIQTHFCNLAQEGFLSPTLASLYKIICFLLCGTSGIQTFSLIPSPLREATITLQTDHCCRLPGVASPKLHPRIAPQISITYGVFSWPSAKGAFVSLRKVRMFPHQAWETSVTHQVLQLGVISLSTPILTFQKTGSKLNFLLLNFPPLHSHMVIYIQNIFLS